MRRTFVSLTLFAFGGLAMAGGCSSASVPIGQDVAGSSGGGNGSACGTSTCTQGELCCPGPDAFCTPTCMRVSACPVLGRACQLPLDAADGLDAVPGADVSPGEDASTSFDARPLIDGSPTADGPIELDAQGGPLRWYLTCGDPVCRVPESDAGVSAADGGACPPIGSSCAAAGDACGVRNSNVACGATEVCATKDPTVGGMCPRSSRSFKDEIRYVDSAQLEQLHDETLRIRLATYNYKAPYADPKPRRLGFIIEDDPANPAVDPAHDSIELYGYLSMVVATMQVQEKEIASLKRELAESRQSTCTPRGR